MPLATRLSVASRIAAFACLALGGCDVVGFAGALPALGDVTAEFGIPARGTAVLRTGRLQGGTDTPVSAYALGADEPDSFLYIEFCDGANQAGALYDQTATYASLEPGRDLSEAYAAFRGSGRAAVRVTGVADDGSVSGVFVTDIRSEGEVTRRRVQGAFNASPVGPAHTCRQ